MKFRWIVVLASLLATLTTACPAPDPTTEIVVRVTSTLNVPEDFDSLRLRVYDDKGKLAQSERVVKQAQLVRPGSMPFPLSFSLSSPGNEATSFQLVVTGVRSARDDMPAADVVEVQRKGRFEPNRRLLMELALDRSCLDMLCREGKGPSSQTCMSGACDDVLDTPLEPFDGVEINNDSSNGDPGSRDGGKGAKDGGAGSDGGPVVPGPSCDSDMACRERVADAQPEGCVAAKCDNGKCVFRAEDGDGDGHRTKTCSVPMYSVELGDDCDDAAKDRYPGAWDGPEVEGKPDACDKKDNDCDGNVDDEKAGGKSCACDPATDVDVDCSEREDGTAISWPTGAPVGNRCAYGKRSCVNGAWSACKGAVEPGAKDSCAAMDDTDCDGMPNEGCTCNDGATQPCGTTAGDCEAGTQTCRNGAWSQCTGAVAPAGKDTCDRGSDRDCNGKANEGCECINGTVSTCGAALDAKGECAAVSITCTGGKWPAQSCQSTRAETCEDNGKDENCDGRVNESIVCQCTNGARSNCLLALGQLGTCGLSGRTQCRDGRWLACDVGPLGRDTCANPLNVSGAGDENCNGIPNERCDCTAGERQACSMGTCTGGSQTCNASGEWGACLGCSEPTPTDPPPATLEVTL